ncbi:MAG: NAD(P)H-binding protein [Halobacteriaceae archaeon]
MNILVTGATGFVGSSLIPSLVEEGHTVRAMTRDVASYDQPDDVSVVEGDLLKPSTLDGDFEDIDVAYYLVHSLQTGKDFAERDREAAHNFAQAASTADVDRVIYLGGLGETSGELSEHLSSRREVEAILKTGEYSLTTLRAAIIIGQGSSSFAMIRQLAGRLPIMITPKWVRTKCQPIAIQDVIAYLTGVLDVPKTAGETYEIGGPEVLTYEEILKRTAKQLGNKPIIIPVPVLTPKLSVYWVDLVTNVPKSVAHPLIYGLKNPVVVTDDRIRDLVPIELTPFDQAVTNALES